MTLVDIDDVLNRLAVIRHPCDLDLLLFFVRHPRALISSDQLATFLGYEAKRIGDSLELLLGAGLLTRAQNPTHAARLYVFDPAGPSGGSLRTLLARAATRQGRLAVKQALMRRTPGGAGLPTAFGHDTRSRHQFGVRRSSPRTRTQTRAG